MSPKTCGPQGFLSFWPMGICSQGALWKNQKNKLGSSHLSSQVHSYGAVLVQRRRGGETLWNGGGRRSCSRNFFGLVFLLVSWGWRSKSIGWACCSFSLNLSPGFGTSETPGDASTFRSSKVNRCTLGFKATAASTPAAFLFSKVWRFSFYKLLKLLDSGFK